jgi:predicted Abi (CAAX) family protease
VSVLEYLSSYSFLQACDINDTNRTKKSILQSYILTIRLNNSRASKELDPLRGLAGAYPIRYNANEH